MLTIGNNTAASSARRPVGGVTRLIKVTNVTYPSLSLKDPAKAWTPAHKSMVAVIDFEVYEGENQYPQTYRRASVTRSTKQPGAYSVWPFETLVPGGAAGERFRPGEWNMEISRPLNDVVSNPNSEFNADPNDPGYLSDEIIGQVHDLWYAEVSVAFPDAVKLWAEDGYKGYLGGGDTKAEEEPAPVAIAAPEPEPVAVVPPAPVPPVASGSRLRAPQKPAAAPAAVAAGDETPDPFE